MVWSKFWTRKEDKCMFARWPKKTTRGAHRGPRARTPAHLRPSGIRRRARSAAPSAQLGSRQSSVNTQNNDKVRTSSFNENQWPTLTLPTNQVMLNIDLQRFHLLQFSHGVNINNF
jgi:hypothetical protein